MDWWRLISIEGVACCFTGAICYLIGTYNDRNAQELKSVTRVVKLKDLAELLNVASKVVPLVVAVSGWVGSDTPIKCKYSKRQGVIMQRKEENQYLKRNDKGEWEKKSTLMHSEWKEVPWYLEDATSRVHIFGGRFASDLALSIVGGVFEESKKPPNDANLEEQGIKMLGVNKYEKLLPIGASLTVVGEAFKDRSGEIVIAQPDGGPFYVTYDTLGGLIESFETSSVCWKYASMMFTVIGVGLIAKRAYEYISRNTSEYIRRRRYLQEMRRLQQIQNFREESRRLLAAASGQAKKEEEGSDGTAENVPDVTKKDRTETDTCSICFEQEYNSVFVPCGHMCCCMACSLRLTLCPVCRAKIKQVVRTYRT